MCGDTYPFLERQDGLSIAIEPVDAWLRIVWVVEDDRALWPEFELQCAVITDIGHVRCVCALALWCRSGGRHEREGTD